MKDVQLSIDSSYQLRGLQSCMWWWFETNVKTDWFYILARVIHLGPFWWGRALRTCTISLKRIAFTDCLGFWCLGMWRRGGNEIMRNFHHKHNNRYLKGECYNIKLVCINVWTFCKQRDRKNGRTKNKQTQKGEGALQQYSPQSWGNHF